MKKLIVGISSMVLALGIVGYAGAALINMSGNFAGSDPWSYPYGTVPETLSGSWSLTFDDSVLTGAATESFDNLPLDSLTLNPSMVGATTFTAANSVGNLWFNSGALVIFGVGGVPEAGRISAQTDDWMVLYAGPGFPIHGISVAVVSDPGISEYQQISGSISITEVPGAPVPIPGAIWLLASGLAGLVALRRKFRN